MRSSFYRELFAASKRFLSEDLCFDFTRFSFWGGVLTDASVGKRESENSKAKSNLLKLECCL
jgi:hypothetical protein